MHVNILQQLLKTADIPRSNSNTEIIFGQDQQLTILHDIDLDCIDSSS